MALAPGTTVIARHARIGGRIDTDGAVLIDGRVEGTVRAGDTVVVSASGVAIAEILTRRAEVRGVVIGNVVAEEHIMVAAGARVVGDLRAPEVDIAAGATLEGRVAREGASAPAPAPPPPAAAPPGRPAVRARVPLRRPARPGAASAGTAADPAAPELPAFSARTYAPPAAPPAVPRLAGRARVVPRRKPGGSEGDES